MCGPLDLLLDFSVGVGAFVIGLSQISSFFSSSRPERSAGVSSNRIVRLSVCP